MKSFLLASAFLVSTSVFANSFDNFIGEYKVSGSPVIKMENAKWCNRFNFQKIVGLKVEVNTQGLNQSHIIYFQDQSGSYGYPAMDYNYTNDYGTGGGYAKSTGTSNSASNEYGIWSINPNQKETTGLTVENVGTGYVVYLTEAYYENTTLVAACYYQVNLTKK